MTVKNCFFWTMPLLFAASLAMAQEKTAETKSDTPAPARGQESWSDKMREMAKTLSHLVPYIFDDKKFADPAHLELITNDVKKLGDLAHDLTEKQMQSQVSKLDTDPGMKTMARELSHQLAGAAEAYRSGDRQYTKYAIRSALTYCIACHTRSDLGPEFSKLDFTSGFENLPPRQRLSLLSATRQYELALKEFNKIVGSPSGKAVDPFEIKTVSRIALAIAIRVKHDPELALEVLKKVSSLSDTTGTLSADVAIWRQDVLRWKSDLAAKKTAPTKSSFAETKSLIEQAQRTQRFLGDSKGDVVFLRASAHLHEFARLHPTDPKIAEVYYLLGVCYENLRELGFWTLDETYYESCIEKSPHSAIARKCFDRYKDNTFAGYTGSRGTDIPFMIRSRMSKYEELASPQKKKKK